MELGSVALNSETKGGIAEDPAFLQLAAEAETGIETDLAELAGGGLVALRVEAVEPPAPIPFADVRERVAADWTAARTADALDALADGLRGRASRRPGLRRARRAHRAPAADRRRRSCAPTRRPRGCRRRWSRTSSRRRPGPR